MTTLLDSNSVGDAELALLQIAPEEPSLTGRLREMQERYEEAAQAFERAKQPDNARRNWHQSGQLREKQERYEEAAQAFERAGQSDDTRRNWRMAGRWEQAIPLIKDGDERADLQWLADLEQLIRRRPVGQGGRLTNSELQRLVRLVSPLSKPED